MQNLVQRDADRLDTQRAKLDVKVQEIIREQEQVVEASEKGIEKLNSDLTALHKRLLPYVEHRKGIDDTYYDLKDRYENKLEERYVLESAWNEAQESISAARLHVIPGEDRRE